MELKKATKLFKRIWKTVVWAELAVLAGVLLFMFSHFFSYDVFVSNFYDQAIAGTLSKSR